MTGGSRQGRRLRHVASACAALGVAVGAGAACYSSGNGTPPPANLFYYPIGLAVSASGNVLYAANSDFDLQYNAGTVQSYDLSKLRIDAVRLMLGLYSGAPAFDAGAADAGEGIPVDAGPLPFSAPSDAGCPFTQLYPPPINPNLPNDWNGLPGRLPIGQACAPPMNSQSYYEDSVQIGAFATDIQMSMNKDRLFVPVRGSATIAWIDVKYDGAEDAGPPPNATTASFPPFSISGKDNCGAGSATKPCDSAHNAGQLSDPGNTRQLAMPGEPFAMALSDDGTAIALTHQAPYQLPNSTNTVGVTSLYLSGMVPGNAVPNSPTNFSPSIQFIVENMPFGGDGIVAVPHDPAAITNPDPANPLRPAFLETNNQSSEVDLLRYYTDEGYQAAQGPDAGYLVEAGVAATVGSSNLRPFLMKERAYFIAANASDNNNRGIAIDPTPRIACEQNALAAGVAVTSPQYVACAQTPARVFIASRSPNSTLIEGTIGGMSEESAAYDPDQLVIYGNTSIPAGASNIYVAPVIDQNGDYAVRVFVVCFDSQTIVVYDPDAQRVENVITTGPGPFAMAFDPFDITDVAMRRHVPADPRSSLVRVQNGQVAGPALLKYRFAYVTSFTDSYVQVLDLDGSFQDDRLEGVSAYETMVYTLGVPTQPVSSN
jgi:hypothetical protein